MSDLNCVELLYLLHVAAQFGVGRFVDSVPVHWYFDLLVQLEDHQGVVDVSAAQTNTSRHFGVLILRDRPAVYVFTFSTCCMSKKDRGRAVRCLTRRDGLHEG